MKALEFENVSYRYPGEDFDIIDGLSFAVEPGSFHCIVGVSGCGKSTILRMTCGLLKPRSGRILVNGAPIDGQSHYCGYMPQRDLLFPWRTVGENLALPLEIRGGYTKAERRELAESALEDVGLAGCADKLPGELSGGMRQRAAFARTMLAGSGLLLLDEPFSALDALTKREIHRWYMGMMERLDLATLFITHDIDEAVLLSDRICILSGQPGQIAAELVIQPRRPRALAFSLSEEFMAYKRQILSLLEGGEPAGERP